MYKIFKIVIVLLIVIILIMAFKFKINKKLYNQHQLLQDHKLKIKTKLNRFNNQFNLFNYLYNNI